MNLYARFLRFLIRSSMAGTGTGTHHRREPAARDQPRAERPGWAWSIAVAVIVPTVAGCLLIPFRDQFGISSAIVFVLPTLFVALARGLLAAVVAAVTSAAMYNLLLTEPYYSLRIDETAEVVAMVVLVLAGVVVGITSTQLRDMTQAASIRRVDVDAFVALAEPGLDPDERAKVTCRALTTMLNASSAEWLPRYHGSVDPVLNRNGKVQGHDVRALPAMVEIPSRIGNDELGRFVVRSNGRNSSNEERAAALALVDIFTRFAAHPSSS